MKDVPLKNVIGWGITIILAVAAGTFALTKYSNEQTVETLKQRISIEEKKRLHAEQIASAKDTHTTLTVIPAKELAEELKNPEISELASRLDELEQEKRSLIEQISNKSVSSLDPRSELSGLIDQLNSKEPAERGKAIDSLFELSDPVSFDPLVQYFLKFPDEATRGHNPSIGGWYNFFINTNESAGIEFVVGQLENSYRFYSGVSYSTLERQLDTINRISNAIPHLQNVALRSSNSSARAYAKLLLEKVTEKKEEIITEEKEEKSNDKTNKPSLRELIEEVLKEIKEIKKDNVEQKHSPDGKKRGGADAES